MFKRYAIGVLAVSAAAAFTLAGCAGDQQSGQAAATRADAASAVQLASAAAGNLHLDYDRLASPSAAMSASKAVVRGTLVDVTEGITYGGKTELAGRDSSFVTLVIKVDSALKGAQAGSTIHVQLNTGGAKSAAQLASDARNLKVVAVLDDISGWTPAPGVTVVRPAGVPAKGPLFFAYPDGLWLQGSADAAMVGVHANTADLSTGWGSPRTLDQYWATLQKAAK